MRPTASTSEAESETVISADRAIEYERELAKAEEARIASLENQATAILGLIIAVAAFSVSTIDRTTLEQHRLAIGSVVVALFLAAGFAIAARGPRALSLRFWTAADRRYGILEARLEKAEEMIRTAGTTVGGEAILESWCARRAVFAYLAERKALWLTCALGSLLASFVAAAVAALIITT